MSLALFAARRRCITRSGRKGIEPLHKRLLLVVAGLTATAFGVAPASATTIAYTSLGAYSHVMVMDGDGSDRRALTSGSVVDVSPVWSPGGTRLAFVRRRNNRSDDLFRVNRSGTGVTRLTRTGGSEANPVWSPGGGRIAFEYGGVISSFEIVVVDADGTNRRALTTNRVPDLEPAWAPGGGRIAFSRFVRGSNSEIFSVGSDGNGLERLTSTRAEEHHPDWSSTGKIAFVRFHAGADDLVVMNGDGRRKRVIWSSRGIVAASWSPDGSRLAVELFDGNDHELFSVSANGNTRRRLTRNDADDFEPVWSPSGAWIAFTRFAGGSNDVWRMQSDGSRKRRLTTSSRHEAAGDWTRDPA